MITNPVAINVASRAVIVVENFRVSMLVSMVCGIRSIQSPPRSVKQPTTLPPQLTTIPQQRKDCPYVAGASRNLSMRIEQ